MSADLGAIKKSYGFDAEGHFHGTADVGIKSSFTIPTAVLQEAYKPPTVLKTFVSGSTPDHLSQRYLVSLPSSFLLLLCSNLHILSLVVSFAEVESIWHYSQLNER